MTVDMWGCLILLAGSCVFLFVLLNSMEFRMGYHWAYNDIVPLGYIIDPERYTYIEKELSIEYKDGTYLVLDWKPMYIGGIPMHVITKHVYNSTKDFFNGKPIYDTITE